MGTGASGPRERCCGATSSSEAELPLSTPTNSTLSQNNEKKELELEKKEEKLPTPAPPPGSVQSKSTLEHKARQTPRASSSNNLGAPDNRYNDGPAEVHRHRRNRGKTDATALKPATSGAKDSSLRAAPNSELGRKELVSNSRDAASSGRPPSPSFTFLSERSVSQATQDQPGRQKASEDLHRRKVHKHEKYPPEGALFSSSL